MRFQWPWAWPVGRPVGRFPWHVNQFPSRFPWQEGLCRDRWPADLSRPLVGGGGGSVVNGSHLQKCPVSPGRERRRALRARAGGGRLGAGGVRHGHAGECRGGADGTRRPDRPASTAAPHGDVSTRVMESRRSRKKGHRATGAGLWAKGRRECPSQPRDVGRGATGTSQPGQASATGGRRPRGAGWMAPEPLARDGTGIAGSTGGTAPSLGILRRSSQSTAWACWATSAELPGRRAGILGTRPGHPTRRSIGRTTEPGQAGGQPGGGFAVARALVPAARHGRAGPGRALLRGYPQAYRSPVGRGLSTGYPLRMTGYSGVPVTGSRMGPCWAPSRSASESPIGVFMFRGRTKEGPAWI